MILQFSLIAQWNTTSDNYTYGKLGIGINAPTSNLHIYGNSNGWMQSIKGTATIAGEFIGIKLHTGYSGEYNKWAGLVAVGPEQHGNSPALGFYAAQAERMRLLSNGYLGIGTKTPLTKIHLEGNSNGWFQTIKGTVTNNEEFVGIKLHTGYVDEFQKWAGIVAVCPGPYGNSPALGFYAGQNEQMRLLSNGDLGIGTTAPDSKLTVKGSIHAEEVKVDLSVPGPDYVFEENYPLASLDEIKAYITENKHLPEVPSAKEMEANGIELGEMNMLLLKKIEELTLHMIDMKKEINELKEKNEELEARLGQ